MLGTSVPRGSHMKINVGKHQRNVKDNGKNIRRIVEVLKKTNIWERILCKKILKVINWKSWEIILEKLKI